MLDWLGLDATAVPANDPFFGRAGRMLAVNQRIENLKTELTVRLYGDLDDGTAVVSCNCHREHFGETFEIRTADGEVAHSACVGFGMERIALALLRTHGLDVDRWPAPVRDRLFRERSAHRRPRRRVLAALRARCRPDLDRDQLLRRPVGRGAAFARP